MSYQVIARKWRPKTFEEVTGQEHITRTLRNAIEHERLHHAYLFSGARGVGKTTTARLLAKALNCHKAAKPDATSCDTDHPDACPSCVEISESRSMDVFEFDAASNTQVEKIREIILEGINVAPARDRYKIFIIDEVHMLSTSSFNALLKTVEEPPPGVVFIMATTELHKVPDTILSRCQQFEFRTIGLQKIFERLRLIADAESITADDAALREIARSGEGSMRDAQSNFDQVISFTGNTIGAADVSAALGIAGADMLARVLTGIAERNASSLLAVVEELIARGHDLRNFARDLLGVFRDLLVYKVGGSIDLVESSIFTEDEMIAHSAAFSETDLLRFFNSLAETETKFKDAAQPRYMLEIGLVKLVEMRRAAAVEDIIARLSELEQRLAGSAPPENSLAATVPEKKTLIPELVVEEAGERVVLTGPDVVETDAAVLEPVLPEEPASGPSISVDLSFLDSVPVKMPPLDPADIEQFDDQWLDAAYEDKLARSGDNLLPIAVISSLIEQIMPTQNGEARAAAATGERGTAAAIAAQFISRVPEPEMIGSDVPPFPENPTDAELMAYAQQHPTVRRALRAFRAKIVDVRRV